ncbi:prolipoprotein diacylglyceryl transferase [Aquimarina sp. ERC-38]|uniref:prolipoprotein diacylglyceryl transferase n=1 Tax=Aquimarina sp. ERC-38 TaxID=2949996 RepID=UPI002247E993|nr:prolipoprotein diacylglyceryl transferase [Aquimarina sp. ERC-38]UZO81702.1 prolipoprotein diacylglyceryl transferase [Aquimarina sp. ERC-38]
MLINWNPDPEITRLFGILPIRYYGLFFVTGLLLGVQVVKKVYKSEGVPVAYLETLASYLFLGTIIGARLGHCLFYDFDYYADHILEMFIPFREVKGSWQFTGFTGLASHGGAIGILVAITIYCIKYKMPFLKIMDYLSIGIPVGCIFIRLGNFMNSEIYGKPTNGDYGVVFMRDDLIPRHPTQLYEAFLYLLVFITVYFYYQKLRPKYDGVLFGIFLIGMFVSRFLVEFFKENQVAFEDNMTLNMGQWLSIPFIVIGVFFLFYNQVFGKNTAEFT